MRDIFSNFFIKFGIYTGLFVITGFAAIHFWMTLTFLWIVFTGQF